MKRTNPNAAALSRRINAGEAVTLRGTQSLLMARRLLEHALSSAGYAITFDPESAPDLVDYLTVSADTGLEFAAIGAGVGTLIGLAFDRPAAGAAIGAGLGLAAGAARGVESVRLGWRVRAIRGADGTPSVTIRALEQA